MSEKTFTGLYLDRELLDDIARELSEANCRTRNEFINKAIRFYIAHLHCRNNSEVLTPALESVVEPISLEEPVYTDGGDAMYVIDQVRDPDGEDSWISGLQFRQTVAGLTPREKRIMELRYLQGKTQMEVAREIGISQAQVSRLEKGALSQFRTRD